MTSSFFWAVIYIPLPTEAFIFSGDQFLRFSFHEAIANLFFLRKEVDLGSLNAWQAATQTIDGLFFMLCHLFGVSIPLVDRIHTFICLLLSICLPYWGFLKLADFYFQTSRSRSLCLIAALIFAINPYTLQLWHGGVFNISAVLCYGCVS